jgi:hypothetical protein
LKKNAGRKKSGVKIVNATGYNVKNVNATGYNVKNVNGAGYGVNYGEGRNVSARIRFATHPERGTDMNRTEMECSGRAGSPDRATFSYGRRERRDELVRDGA